MQSKIFFSPWKQEKDYVQIMKRPDKPCASNVGHSEGVQIWSINQQCLDYREIMHHLFHILGFAHEHNRPDREDYIESQ